MSMKKYNDSGFYGKSVLIVTTTTQAIDALTMLREKKNGLFDLVICDIYMPDMDGFKLIERIGLEMDLPVVMMSSHDNKDVVMNGVKHGACDCLAKPITMQTIKYIWQHVVRKRMKEMKEADNSGSIDGDYACSVNQSTWKSCKRKKENEGEMEESDDNSATKKQRLVWSIGLHKKFVTAVNTLGAKAVPKKILELMDAPGVTRENVASHLQCNTNHMNTLHNLGLPEGNYGAMQMLDGTNNQLSLQGLPKIQAELETESSGISIPFGDHRDIFYSIASNLRFEDERQLHHNNDPVNSFHGFSTTIDPRQLAYLQQPVHSYGNMGVQVSMSSHPGYGNQHSSLVMRTVQSNIGNDENILNGMDTMKNQLPHPSSIYPTARIPQLAANGFPLVNTLMAHGFKSSGMVEEGELQKLDSNHFVSRHGNHIHGNLNVSALSELHHHGVLSTHNDELSIVGKPVLVLLENENEHGNQENNFHTPNSTVNESLHREKVEALLDVNSEGNNMFPKDQLGQDDYQFTS
ncbi:hypothetical protein IFM89_032900 [Coptis chinensis]|uniref:Response regulatory domain-containing protein n=1 Tax=Coptis chinensis TaxID=261450 RepID=A0A835M815_9MAGN|nr:hypothetical protein IFM89_032900 [Coptis chinensis]